MMTAYIPVELWPIIIVGILASIVAALFTLFDKPKGRYRLRAGTLIHVNGVPFVTSESVCIDGHPDNLKLTRVARSNRDAID